MHQFVVVIFLFFIVKYNSNVELDSVQEWAEKLKTSFRRIHSCSRQSKYQHLTRGDVSVCGLKSKEM